MKKVLALVLAAMLCLVMSVAALAEAPTPEETAGFAETPIGGEDGVEIEVNDPTTDSPILVASAVYFQPVDMLPEMGQAKADSDIHLEVDVAAAEGNQLGYEAGTWIPYMTVDYAIVDEAGEVIAEGSFMTMNASDGPHYGCNMAMPNNNEAGLYTLRVTFHSPAEQNYMLHVDAETGVEGRFWEEPITIEFENWQYEPLEY